MEEKQADVDQQELLARIHNQLVDLKKVIIEIELSKPGTSHALQTRLRQIMGDDQHIDAGGHTSSTATRQQLVIAPPENMDENSK